MQLTFLCITSEFKGIDFIKACKAAGNNVFVITAERYKDKPWPFESIDDIFYVREVGKSQLNFEDIKAGLNHFVRSNKIDRIVGLDDFDVEKAAHLREHFRIPGMGETTSRHFRDKLGMRMKAAGAGLKVPPFSALFHDEDINHFANTIAAPWVVKPRGQASATGIKKVYSKEELWNVIHDLGDDRPNYLVEQFKPGAVYHVDSLIWNGKCVFASVSKYLSTPMEVAHGGGIFRSHIVEFGSEDDNKLQKFNKEVLKAFGLQLGASHTEFIKAEEDGEFYFLETSSRVGGAHLAEMVEFSSGINLWAEWAKIENAAAKEQIYKLPKAKMDYAGIVVSLSKYQHPDSQSFNEPELVWRLQKDYHIGMIIQSNKRERVLELLDDYANRIFQDYHTHV